MSRTSVSSTVKPTTRGRGVHTLPQRRCACGQHAPIGGQCTACSKKQSRASQAAYLAGESDPQEQEARHIAARLMATRSGDLPGVSPRSQRHTVADSVHNGAQPPMMSVPAAPNLSSGRALDSETLAYFEPRLGRDLSHVRVHNDAAAAEQARSYQALAFAYGHHIVLGKDVGSLHSPSGRAVLAHELAHTLQQESSVPRIQRLSLSREDFAQAGSYVLDAATNLPGQISDAASSAASGVYDTAVETASDIAEYGYEQLIELLERYAPRFLAFLRAGPVEFIKQAALTALDSLLGGLVGQAREHGLGAALSGLLGEAFDGIGQIVSDLAAGDCSSLFSAITTITEFAQTAFGPLVDELRTFASSAAGFFGSVWAQFGKPALAFIESIAGDFWNDLVGLANSFWEYVEPLREVFASAWESFKRNFDLAWDSGVGLLEWLGTQATKAYAAIKEELGPLFEPLQALVGALLLLSPLGPVIAVVVGYQAISSAISWLYTNWGSVRQWFIDARTTLAETILPALINGLESVADALGSAAGWLAEQLANAASAVRDVAEALGLSPLLNAARSLVATIATEVESIATWARDTFAQVAQSTSELLRSLHAKLRPLYGLVIAILVFPVNPFLLPVVVAGWFWRLTPDCIKEPVIDWTLELMRAALAATPNFSNFGEAWPQARQHLLRTLDSVSQLPMEEKIAASNRIARMMTLEDIQWIGNLVAAASEMPDHFVGQIEEELIGIDLGQPLPFERAAPIEQAASNMGMPPALDSSSSVSVDQVVPFNASQELVESLGLIGDGEVTLPGADPQWANLAAIRNEAAIEPATQTAAPDGSPGVMQGATDTASVSPEDETEARLQALIDAPLEDTCQRSAGETQVAAPAQVPEELKFGPLSQAQRGRYMFAQMRKGIGQWFHCNKAWLIPSIILAVIVLIAAEILTGGAITAALPAIFEILTAVMIGVAAVRSAVYLGSFVTQGASGQITQGARSLARGLAVIAIELVFALLFNLNSVIKSLKSGLTAALHDAAAAARAFGRTTVEAAQTLGRTALRGARNAIGNVSRVAGALVRRGRIVMEGLGSGLGRGIRSLRDLARRLSRLRFRRFIIRRFGRRIQLWAEINPLFLLADGSIEELTYAGSGARATLGARAVAEDGSRGIIVAVRDTHPTSYVRYLESLPDAERRKLFRQLSRLSEADRHRRILQIGQTAENARILRANMTGAQARPGRGTPGGGRAAHHIVPSTHSYPSAEKARKILADCGIDINHGLNGVFLEQAIHGPLHSHAYMDAVLESLKPLTRISNPSIRNARALMILDDLASRILRGAFP